MAIRCNLTEVTWFDINNYKCVRTWDNKTLFWQLNERRFAYTKAGEGLKVDSATFDKIERAITSGNPLFNFVGRRSKVAAGGVSLSDDQLTNSHLDKAVTPLTVYDASGLYHKAKSKPKAQRTDELLSGGEGEPLYAYLKINLSTNQALITKEFSSWLKTKKSKSSKPTAGKTADATKSPEQIRKLILSYKIVAFLDLIIWENLSGHIINRESIVNKLIKKHTCIPSKEIERLRKLANHAISTNFLSSLRSI